VSRLKDILGTAAGDALTEQEQKLAGEVAAFEEKFDAAMDDDFNTADAISAIFELVRFANAGVTSENTKAYAQLVYDEIVKLADILGLIVEKEEEILAEDIEKLIEERQAARKAKNFARADEIRDELLEKGIVLKDTREGVKWTKA
jgi:cysteinyl-tRNA synthetase